MNEPSSVLNKASKKKRNICSFDKLCFFHPYILSNTLKFDICLNFTWVSVAVSPSYSIKITVLKAFPNVTGKHLR